MNTLINILKTQYLSEYIWGHLTISFKMQVLVFQIKICPYHFDWQFWLADCYLCTCHPGKGRDEEGMLENRWRISSKSVSPLYTSLLTELNRLSTNMGKTDWCRSIQHTPPVGQESVQTLWWGPSLIDGGRWEWEKICTILTSVS